jgi:hypothetical protein
LFSFPRKCLVKAFLARTKSNFTLSFAPTSSMDNLPTNQTCKSCGNHFNGYYCNLCGEKVLLPADRSFKKFLSNILIAITFADSKMIKTLWLTLADPGFVSKEFAEGKRVKYLKPLSLFFVLNLIYFLFPLIQLFSASLNTQLLSAYRDVVKEAVSHKMMAMSIRDVQSFSVIYNLKTTGLAKLLVMVFVIIASLPLNAFYRTKNRYFTDHVGYMVELACFNLFVNAIFLTLIVKLFGLGHYLDETVLASIFVTTNLYFLLRSGITFYEEDGWQLVFKSMLMIIILKVALEVYRGILFFVTIWSL